MAQIARNVTDGSDGSLRGKRFLMLDRDAKYNEEFRNVLIREGVRVIRLPFRSPNLNAFGALCPFSKGRVFESDDLRRAGIASARAHPVCDPLQLAFILPHLAMSLIN